MRRYIKKKLVEIINSLKEGHALLSQLYEKNEQEALLNLLQELQETAIAVGAEIESAEGETHPTVGVLEEYCELLWQCGEEKSIERQRKICKQLEKKCIRIENSVKWDIKEQYDVVFMPYKASMWDSLESVWLAAKEDKNCNCYVMPIPYFDRNSDRTFGKMHYEGDLYPYDVPITSYLSYDLKENCPEVIVIHNPYDEYNYVTSVHPDYYSSKLKEYTEMLVYIPYFVTMGHVQEEMCVAQGVINADLVVVQSEEVRQEYLQALEVHLNPVKSEDIRTYFEQKIVALGSPKIDKVMNTKKEDIILPKDWEEKIYG
ncbi:MAG: hypothetical protein RSA90_03010 [Lachnospiraceae bacterium]